MWSTAWVPFATPSLLFGDGGVHIGQFCCMIIVSNEDPPWNVDERKLMASGVLRVMNASQRAVAEKLGCVNDV